MQLRTGVEESLEERGSKSERIRKYETKQHKTKKEEHKRPKNSEQQVGIAAEGRVVVLQYNTAYLAEFSKTFHNVRSLLWHNAKTKIYWRRHLIVVSIISITTTTSKTKNCSVLLSWQGAWWSSHRSGKSM